MFFSTPSLISVSVGSKTVVILVMCRFLILLSCFCASRSITSIYALPNNWDKTISFVGVSNMINNNHHHHHMPPYHNALRDRHGYTQEVAGITVKQVNEVL